MIGQISTLLQVAYQSLRYRMSGVLLTILSVALSVFVLLGVEHVRQETRSGFASTVSGVDLIVGARTGDINLLLLSVFRIGNATANVTWDAVEAISEEERVSWVVPISLGDSHKNFRVVGTTEEFFERYKYGGGQPLDFIEGQKFNREAEVVLGAQVAVELSYGLGDSLILSHGMADVSFSHHDQVPIEVVGVLERTGTPVDNALFVNLETIEAIHADEEEHEHEEAHHDEHEHEEAHHDEHEHEEAHHDEHDHEEAHHDEHEHEEAHHDEHDHEEAHHDEHDHEEAHHDEHEGHSHPPLGTVTALLVGLESQIATLQVQRWINEYAEEPLLAILPGVALTQLWELVGNVENVLRGISILVFISSLLGLNAMLLASMRERRREIDILRSIGAPSLFILALLVIESLLIVTVGVIIALAGLLTMITLINTVLVTELGILLSLDILYSSSLIALGLIYLTALLLSLWPAFQAYSASRAVGSSPSV